MTSLLMEALRSDKTVRQQSESKTSLMNGTAGGLPPRPDSRKTNGSKADQNQISHRGDDGLSVHRSRNSKAKDTISEVSQGGGDMVKRVLYEKNEIIKMNKDLREQLAKIQEKYKKLRDCYERLRDKYVKAKKTGSELPDLNMLENSILGEPVIQVNEPVFKFSSSIDYGDSAAEQLEFFNGERSPMVSRNDFLKPMPVPASPRTHQIDWLTIPPVSPVLENREKALTKENKQLRTEITSLKTELEQLKITHSKCTIDRNRGKQQLEQLMMAHSKCATDLNRAKEELERARKEQQDVGSLSVKSTQLRDELVRTRSRLSSQYEKLVRIKDIVKDIDLKDFVVTTESSSSPVQGPEKTEEERAKLMLQKFFSESS